MFRVHNTANNILVPETQHTHTHTQWARVVPPSLRLMPCLAVSLPPTNPFPQEWGLRTIATTTTKTRTPTACPAVHRHTTPGPFRGPQASGAVTGGLSRIPCGRVEWSLGNGAGGELTGCEQGRTGCVTAPLPEKEKLVGWTNGVECRGETTADIVKSLKKHPSVSHHRACMYL